MSCRTVLSYSAAMTCRSEIGSATDIVYLSIEIIIYRPGIQIYAVYGRMALLFSTQPASWVSTEDVPSLRMLLPVTTLGQMTQIAAPLFNRSRLLVTMEAKGAKIPFSPLPPATLLSATP